MRSIGPRLALVACLLAAVIASSHAAELSNDEVSARRELAAALFSWIEATNARDFEAQSQFYPERMQAFYLWRDVPKKAVLAEKRRVFARASEIDIGSDAPQIIVEPGARAGRMYFRKSYVIDGAGRGRKGEVLQELRWERQEDGWKIVSERDLRVIRHARAPTKVQQRSSATQDPG